jgi:3D (Asp-Asp-Asp) domain-containing protein
MKRLIPILLLLVASNSFAETVTAYCSCIKCCGKNATGLAANGKKPVEGVTCAGPRSIPLGTKVFIEGVGVRTVTDRLARKYDDRYDIYFKDHTNAVNFGIRTLKVTIWQYE